MSNQELSSTTSNAQNLYIGAGEFFFERILTEAEIAEGKRSKLVSLGEVSSANFTQDITTVEKNSSLRAPREVIAKAVTARNYVATLALDEYDPLNVAYALYGEAGIRTIAEEEILQSKVVSPGEVLQIENALNFTDLEIALLIPEQSEIKQPVLSAKGGATPSTVSVTASGSYTGQKNTDYYLKIVHEAVKAGILAPQAIISSGLTTGSLTSGGAYTGSQKEDFYVTISVTSEDAFIDSATKVTSLASDGSVLTAGTYTGTADEDYYIKITAANTLAGDLTGLKFAYKVGASGTYGADIDAEVLGNDLADGIKVTFALQAGENFADGEEYKFAVKAERAPKFVFQKGLQNPVSANMELDNNVLLTDGVTVSFAPGHYQKGDQWKITAQVDEQAQFVWREELTGSYSTIPVNITGVPQPLDKGVNVKFDLSVPTATIVLGDEWKIEVLAQRTKLQPGVDFKCDETDARGGFIHILPDAAIAENTNIIVRCQVPGRKYPVVYGGLNNGVQGRLVFNGDPTHGKSQIYEFHKVSLAPNGDFPLISTEFASFSIDCTVLSDRENHPDNPFYRVTYSGMNNDLQSSMDARP